MMTKYGDNISDEMIAAYMGDLVNRFYKILPIKENEEDTMQLYAGSLLRELSGFKELMAAMHGDDRFVSLLAILEHFTNGESDLAAVKSDVFRAINIIKKLKAKHCPGEGE